MLTTLLAWLPFYPLISFILLVSLGKRLSWQLATVISVSSVGLSALTSVYLSHQIASQPNNVLTVELWQWFSFQANYIYTKQGVNVGFMLDSLSAVMIMVVSGIGFLIHVFASAYMKSDEHFTRFMAYMNLFIVAMLILVLADNLVLLYLGWEGVGLCSFLLIGFWYQDRSNVLAARKAFIVTRIGDTSLAIGLFLLFDSLYTLSIVELSEKAAVIWQVGDAKPYWIALFLLGGAVGKSAQLPLQTWLPDAMAGPTPVSALIHAATMVTAGVYLIARMHGIFILSPEVMSYVAWVGGLTLILAGCAALTQSDIKRVLAYSTMSQIGYMMLALGAGAWSAGIFHLMTHAFFKALLFLSAGAVILALHHHQNLFKMGGLLKRLPFESAVFIVGLLCLMAVPGTSGFFSKEAIIGYLWSSPTAGEGLWWLAIIGALITSVYSCRLFFLAFLGQSRFEQPLQINTSKLMKIALLLLALLSLFGGFMSPDLSSVLPTQTLVNGNDPAWLHPVAIATPFVGIAFSWFYFAHYRDFNVKQLLAPNSRLTAFFEQGLGFDALYHGVFVKPYCLLTRLNKRDVFDQLLMLTAWYSRLCYDALSALQTGNTRWYAASLGVAVLFIIGVFVL